MFYHISFLVVLFGLITVLTCSRQAVQNTNKAIAAKNSFGTITDGISSC